MEAIRVKDKEWQLAGVHYVRTEAMCNGFGVSLEMEFGEDKAGDEYILVLDGIHPVSTCRLHQLDENTGKIERVATLKEYRGQHYGAAAITAADLVENPDTVVLDTSTAHRTAPGWVYGFPELSPEREAAIRTAKRIAVPGCHASGFVVLTYPLVEAGILPPDALLTCYSLTGYSGGGKKMIAEIESPDRAPELYSPRFYGLANNHKHLPEMQKICGLAEPPVFCPIVDDYYCGMEVTVPLRLDLVGHSAEELATALQEYYAGETMIKVHALGTAPKFLPANTLAGKDTLEIYPTVSPDGKRMLLISLLDNLGKGSSGAAVQCMNIMLGLEETKGLEL